VSDLKTTEKNKLILQKLLKMSPHAVAIVENVLKDLESSRILVETYQDELNHTKNILEDSLRENEVLKEEIRSLKIVH
jgi:hypothetical protein